MVGGVYLISWLTHVWGGQPWPINSNMVNYAVVLVLFGVSLLLFGNLLPAFCRRSAALCEPATRVCRAAAAALWHLRW
ncbi:hypothetical protein NIA69_04120 [Gemmiger formicilis]|nr:hypothetical protein [Gemmiger formicilis]